MGVYAEPGVIETEALAAKLTAAAYDVALRHGFKGSFLELQLDLWRQLRAALRREGHPGEEQTWR